ncbi:MAG: sigma 54-interacting transcriptional regulator [Pseudobdellovibrio sp.]
MLVQANKIHILILDDETMWQLTTEEMCKDILSTIYSDRKMPSKENFKFFIVSTVDAAKDILDKNEIHLFLLDKDLGQDQNKNKISGVDFITEFKSIQPLTQIVMLTADTSTKDVAQAMKNGASNYLYKTNDESQRELRVEVIKKTLEVYVDEMLKTKASVPTKKGLYSNYVCQSPAMQRLDHKFLAMSESKRPVLILGQTGLGKGAAARRISELSKTALEQAQREFVQLNIASTEKTLVDAILFGTEPGAFTDASKQTKAGLLDVARDGDIFLDEIGDASLELQLKLLKVVEEKEYYRVGGNRPIKTNARFIFATNKNLQELIGQGKFREDLYMRISVFEVVMPALSERKEDVPSIIQGFLQNACRESKNRNVSIEDLPEDLMTYFMRDEIPGNIRGIENDIERLVAHARYDEFGRPQLYEWKKLLSLQPNSYSRRSQLLGVEQLLKTKTNFLEKDFPGLFELNQILEGRIIEEVQEKGLGVREAAKLLKISVNTLLSRQRDHTKRNEKSL